MTTLRQAAQMALDAMLNFPDDISDDMFESIKALRAALAQPEQEIETDRPHVENDGCPTEKAVLQRFWREHQAQPEQEPTRSQKLRDAGYTRRPKGWSKDGEEPEQCQHQFEIDQDAPLYSCCQICGEVRKQSEPESEPSCKTGSQCIGGKCERCLPPQR